MGIVHIERDGRGDRTETRDINYKIFSMLKLYFGLSLKIDEKTLSPD